MSNPLGPLVPKKKPLRLEGIERKLGDGRPLHFFLKLEELGLLGQLIGPTERRTGSDYIRWLSLGDLCVLRES
jgi:hypothetical protein